MKKVAFVIYSMSGGGAEKVLSLISKALQNEYEITIITLANTEDFYETHGIKKLRLALDKPSKNIFEAILNNFERLINLRKELIKFDSVVSFMTETNILCLLSTLGSKTKTVISEHNTRSLVPSILWRTLQRCLYPLATRTVCVSQSVSDEYDFCKNKITIGNPLDPNIFELARQEPTVSLPKHFLVAVGRCDEAKGHQHVIEAFKSIQSDFPEMSLVIVGDGTTRLELEKISLGSNILFTGRVQNPYAVVSRSIALISGSTSEGFGNVLIEAMALKKQVVGFDCKGAVSELLGDGHVGILVPCKDITALAMAMREVIINQNENIAGKRFSENFEVASICDKWREII